jgi:hypothetical protein
VCQQSESSAHDSRQAHGLVWRRKYLPAIAAALATVSVSAADR